MFWGYGFFLFFVCFILRNKMYFGVVLIDILLYIFLFSLYIYGMIYKKYRKIKIKLLILCYYIYVYEIF